MAGDCRKPATEKRLWITPQGLSDLDPRGSQYGVDDRREPARRFGGRRAGCAAQINAYSGKFRVEGNDFTVVDVSWNEEWNGTEQRRHFRLQGDKLFIESAPAPSIVSPGKTDFRRIVWEREK